MSGHCIELPGYTSFAIKILKDVRINISGTTVKSTRLAPAENGKCTTSMARMRASKPAGRQASKRAIKHNLTTT